VSIVASTKFPRVALSGFAALLLASAACAGNTQIQPLQQSAIIWPTGYLPGTTDNFVTNEVIISGLSAEDVWPLLADATKWPTYYANSADVRFYDGKGPVLADGDRFFFKTFGFPVEAQVTEFIPPTAGKPGRVAWHGWAGEEGGADRLDVIHAWLVENLPDGRVRILTQESQVGEPAKKLAASKPNIMINGHHDWLSGLVEAALKAKQS
jgi:hypothetical protein